MRVCVCVGGVRLTLALRSNEDKFQGAGAPYE